MTIGAAAMNVAQTVNTQSSTAQASTSADTDFKSIMKTSMAAGAKNTVSGSKSNTDSQINLKKTSANDVSKENKTSNTQSTNTQKTTDKVSDKVSDKADNSDLKEKIADAVNDVKDKIKKELNVTDEDIANAMETLGITFIDLLQPEKLAQLLGELRQAWLLRAGDRPAGRERRHLFGVCPWRRVALFPARGRRGLVLGDHRREGPVEGERGEDRRRGASNVSAGECGAAMRRAAR